MKKIFIFLSLIILLIIFFNVYQYYTKSVECWFTILYPQFSYIEPENMDIDNSAKLTTKLALVEWLKDVFNFKFLT